MNYWQKDWSEWLASAEFVVNNKAYSTTKVSPFIANYGRENKNSSRFEEKRKGRESNGVCRKDEKGARRGRVL